MTHISIYINPYHTLHQVSSPVHFFQPPMRYTDWSQFEQDFLYTMTSARGIGLAANQIGLTQRFFGMGHSSFDVFRKPAILYNARIITASEEQEIGEEGCLSFPGTYYNVYRAKQVEIEWQTMKGETKSATLRGLEARCFQHELDHIDGITFNKRAEELIN
jgi:peptide deformylase